MAFQIPNESDASVAAQAAPDAKDVDILVAGYGRTGVVSGCEVTAQGTPDMTLAVAAGVVAVLGAQAAVSAGNVTVTTADATNPRFDLVVVSSSGVKSVTAGTPAASPVFPAIPASSVVLAAVYVPANDTAIETAQIVDKRVVLGGNGASALRLAPAYDSYIYAQFSSTNYATATILKLGDQWNAATFASFPILRFSLTDVGATVASAVLHLTVDSGWSGNALDTDNLNVQVRKLLQSYHDTQMTWNVYSTGNAWGTTGARLNGTDRSTAFYGSGQIGRLVAGSTVAINITGLVAAEKAAGSTSVSVILGTTQTTNAQNAVDFSSNDHATAAARPVLAVVSS